jgi:hypothetical protein
VIWNGIFRKRAAAYDTIPILKASKDWLVFNAILRKSLTRLGEFANFQNHGSSVNKIIHQWKTIKWVIDDATIPIHL